MHANIEPTSIVSPTRIAGRPAMSTRDGLPAYRYVGEGRFLPANAAAHEECRRFNAWVDDVNARAANRRIAQ